MKKYRLLSLSLLGTLSLMTGCTGQMTQGENIDSTKQAKECMNLDKQLMKVDNLIIKVNDYPASQIEELAYTLPQPEITQSSNKKRILSDAKKKRSMLLNEQQKMGCKTPTKK